MDSLRQDLRHAVRLSRRTPGVTAIAILALAIGIGANAAIFTVVNAVLLERLPFPDANRLVMVWEQSPRRPAPNVVGPANFLRRRRFAGDAGIVGRAVPINGRPTVVVGVMPPDVGLFVREGSRTGTPADCGSRLRWTPRTNDRQA